MANREIKFRAWHFDLKRMVSCEELTKDQVSLLANGFWANVHPVKESLTTILTYEQMLPLEYTGLKDKNGVEIYEGDLIQLVEADDEEYQKGSPFVIFENGHFQYRYAFWAEDIAVDLSICAERMIVVGNIYTNPELLEAKS